MNSAEVMAKALVKIILTIQNDHNGCKYEALNLAKEALGLAYEHNELRETLNKTDNKEVEKLLSETYKKT